MLDIDLKPTFRRRVEVILPSGVKQDFFASFDVVDVSEQEKFDLGTGEGTRAFLVRAIRGLDDIMSGGETVAYSPELRDRLLDKPWSRGPLFTAYVQGLANAAEGN